MKNKLLKIWILATILIFSFWVRVEAITKIIVEKIPIGYIKENLPSELLENISVKDTKITIAVEQFFSKEPKNKKNPFFLGEINVNMPYGVLIVPIPTPIPFTTLQIKNKIISLEDPEKIVPIIIARILNIGGVKTKFMFNYHPVEISALESQTDVTIFTPAQFLLERTPVETSNSSDKTTVTLKGEILSFFVETEVSSKLPTLFTGFRVPLPTVEKTKAQCSIGLRLEDNEGNIVWSRTYSYNSKIVNPSYILTRTINEFIKDPTFWKTLNTLNSGEEKYEEILQQKLEATTAKKGKKRVVVFPFIDISGRPSLQSVYYTQIKRILEENGYEVIGEEEIDNFLRKEVDPFFIPEKEVIKKLREIVDADFAVVCEIQKVKDLTTTRRTGGLIGTMVGLKKEVTVGEEWLIGGGVINFSDLDSSLNRTYIKLQHYYDSVQLSYEKEDLLSYFFLGVLLYMSEN
ncbi:MAG: hypothetical protein NC833_03975 [Candidatus Omnitrophica bacterium]|nr:hypothetical protein [Candidatus Omnitrophota bacterium]MCM8804395.1 hypothetical protein [Candidatus Omnitrophota bacterium]